MHQKLANLVQLFLKSDGSPVVMATLADSTRLYEDMRREIKAAVGAGVLADPTYAGSLAGYQGLVEDFAESLRNTSVFDRLLSDGALRQIPMQTRIVSMTAAASSSEVGETQPTPVSAISLAQNALAPRKASTILVLSAEVIASTSPASTAFIDGELRTAVSAGMNAGILGAIVAGLTPTPSAGPDAAGVLADVAALLSAVGIKANSRPYLVTTAAVATQLLTMPDASGGQAFPTVTPNGGELAGIPLLISDELDAGTMLLLDASRCAGDSETMTLEMASSASLVMDTAPGASPAEMVSLFQTNSRALRADRWFGFELLDDGAAAAIGSINYSGPVA